MSDLGQLLPDEEPGAPPRSNGELVFAAPWESRLFGMTLALHDAGRFEWSEFQAGLIAAIARHESEGPDVYHYWECWLEAFRTLASSRGWLSDGALADLESELLARPHGHDH